MALLPAGPSVQIREGCGVTMRVGVGLTGLLMRGQQVGTKEPVPDRRVSWFSCPAFLRSCVQAGLQPLQVYL